MLGLATQMDQVVSDGRAVRVEALPIGIAPDEFARALGTKAAGAALERLRHRFAGRRLLLAVDRLDYTKGIPERLRTFRRCSSSRPSCASRWRSCRSRCPSREKIARYRELRQEVNELVGEINGAFSTADVDAGRLHPPFRSRAASWSRCTRRPTSPGSPRCATG